MGKNKKEKDINLKTVKECIKCYQNITNKKEIKCIKHILKQYDNEELLKLKTEIILENNKMNYIDNIKIPIWVNALSISTMIFIEFIKAYFKKESITMLIIVCVDLFLVAFNMSYVIANGLVRVIDKKNIYRRNKTNLLIEKIIDEFLEK